MLCLVLACVFLCLCIRWWHQYWAHVSTNRCQSHRPLVERTETRCSAPTQRHPIGRLQPRSRVHSRCRGVVLKSGCIAQACNSSFSFLVSLPSAFLAAPLARFALNTSVGAGAEAAGAPTFVACGCTTSLKQRAHVSSRRREDHWWPKGSPRARERARPPPLRVQWRLQVGKAWWDVHKPPPSPPPPPPPPPPPRCPRCPRCP